MVEADKKNHTPFNFKNLASLLFIAVSSDKELPNKLIYVLILVAVTLLTELSIPLIFKFLFNKLTHPSEIFIINTLLISYGILWISTKLFSHMRGKLMQKISEESVTILSIRLINNYFNLNFSSYRSWTTGSIINALHIIQRNIPLLMWNLIGHAFPTIVGLIIVLMLLVWFYPVVYGLFIALILTIYIIFTLKFTERALQIRVEAYEYDKQTSNLLLDWLKNYEPVKLFGREQWVVQVCKHALQKKASMQIQSHLKLEWVQCGQSIIIGIGVCFLTFCVGQEVIAGRREVSDFILFNGYLIQFVGPISVISLISRDLKKAVIDLKNIADLLNTLPSPVKRINPTYIRKTPPKIEFRNVSYKYGKRDIFKNLSFQIYPYEKVAITGPSGCGKSTLAKMLLQFYEPQRGKILIDGQDIQKVCPHFLREHIGLVPQNIVLINGTVKENIVFGQKNTTYREIENAVRIAGLSNLIALLPNGLETKIGDDSFKLSGGEAQRLALARLILYKPKVLILDEFTSSLDPQTCNTLYRNLKEVNPYCTIIFITHKTSEFLYADKVITLP